jgi:hypothetical protein
MTAFLEKRKPDFRKFRQRNKDALDVYLTDLASGNNQRAV